MGQLISSPYLYSYFNYIKRYTSTTFPYEDVVWDIKKLGRIKGKTFQIEGGRKVHAFLGVPFAKCGQFEDRFKKPEPVEPWTDVKNCKEFGPRSLQVDMFWDYLLTPIQQDETNCLNMSIFVPELREDEKRPEGMPVMCFVHGGGYIIHSAANYGDYQICRNLCKLGVIVCVIQYRLGLLGFMSTGDDTCPGNFGLWDQLEALIWIKTHIADFGGDKDNVTAFGQSAGAASIDLLSLSPRCRGLIKRIILIGGNAASDWSLNRPKKIIEAAGVIARKMGWTGDVEDTTDLLSFLRSLPPEQCKAAIFNKSAFNRANKGLDFCPVIDGDLLPAPISELRKKAPKIQTIIGTTDFEALLFFAIGRRTQSDLQSFEKQLLINIPDGCKQSEELREEARQLYIRDKTDKLYSDSLMNNSTQRYVQEMSSAGHEVYLYNFVYCNPNSFGLFAFRVPFVAATHCYELRYLFGKGMFAKFRPNNDDLKILDLLTTMFTNYAKTGNPNYDAEKPNWYPTTTDNPYLHLEIDIEPRFVDDYQERRADFWFRVETLKQQDENSNQVCTNDISLSI